MVVAASQNQICRENNSNGKDNHNSKKEVELPVIDLSSDKRSELAKMIVEAAEKFGFFKVINHGVGKEIIEKVEEESFGFFGKNQKEKEAVHGGPSNPFGYGCKRIGFNGDVGEVEYLLLNANPLSISQISNSVSTDPPKFSSVMTAYIEAVRGVACEILDLMAEGLWVPDTQVFSRLIRDVDSDSVLRLNHYPPITTAHTHTSPPFRVGFGEHSDPQILTILRSNDVGGLQISTQDGIWVPVSPDPTALCVNVGDVLQAMTNGRFVSVRHRAITNSEKARLSMVYFGAPPLNGWIRAPAEVVKADSFSLYRPFTWSEYKKATYSLRLGDRRLSLFSSNYCISDCPTTT